MSSAAFDLCGNNEISGENVTLSLNFSSDSSMKTGGECSRFIFLNSKRIKLTVEESSFASGVLFEIYDGPGLNRSEKLWPKVGGSELPPFFVSSGNAMFIRFKDYSQGDKGASTFRGKISSEPYQATCHCRGVRNGKLECLETELQRRCEVKCNFSYMELSINQHVTCDLVKGEWDINIHNMALSCQKVQMPLKVKTTVNFNYVNLTCEHVDVQKVANVFQAFLANNSDISSKGVCFNSSGDNNKDCSATRLHVNCTTNITTATTKVTIIDRIAEPATLKEANARLQDLYTAYDDLKFKDVLDARELVVNKENESFSVANDSFASMVSPWCDLQSDYIKVAGNETSFVCSTCPMHHLYNVTTNMCQKCPSGSFATERARSCTEKEDHISLTPIKSSCDNKCRKGKRVDDISWMCEWCPPNTYQNSSTKINPDCTPCTGDKKTVFPGAQGVAECRDPCPSGAFLNTSSGACQACPIGSYMDVEKHVFIQCKMCETGKTTQVAGSKSSSDCYRCMPGHFYNSSSSMCNLCPTGKYQDEINKDACKDCGNGTTTLEFGSKNPSDCVSLCGAGEFLNDTADMCLGCPKNTYQDKTHHRSKECKDCGNGTTTLEFGSKNPSDCVLLCGAGEFLNDTADICFDCPKNTYQDKTHHRSKECKDCGNGTTTLEFGSKNPSDCVLLCGAGEFLNDTADMCFDCPKNTYQDKTHHRSKECISCGPNKITNETGQSEISQCFVSCKKGSFLDKSDSQCKKCPKGEFQDQPGQDQCKQCPEGKTTTSDGKFNKSACIATCGKGQYYDNANKTCNPCPYGTYQESQNHLSVDCKTCPSKKTSVKGGADDLQKCIAIERRDKFETVKMSLRFTSLPWSDKLKDRNSDDYQGTKSLIEAAIKSVLDKDLSFEGVKVTAMKSGSIVADFELYFNDKVDYVPGEALQIAARSGKVGKYPVSPESLKILDQDCAQPLGMENYKVKDDQITASNYFKNFEPYEGRLNLKGGRGWSPEYTRPVEYLQIDFKREVNITAVATQGGDRGQSTSNLYVKEYKLSLSDDGQNWNKYNENGKTKVKIKNIDFIPLLTVIHFF